MIHGELKNTALLDASYPASPDDAIRTVGQLWRADLNQYDPLLTAELSEPAWSEASLRWLVAPEPGIPQPRVEGVRVGLGDVAAIKTTADMFAQLDDRFGGDHARHSVIQYLNNDVAPLLRGRYTEQVGRALFSTVAEATLLAGWMSYDACHHGLAQRYFLQALRFAQDANDRRLAGSILSAMSHQATFLGRYTQAATLARAALMGISPVATPTLRAQFHAMEARALARTGDVVACEAALSAATKALESRNYEDEPEWISYFDEAELAAEAAHCFRDVNSARRAVAHAKNAMSGSHVRSDFFATMVLADAHLRAGDVEEACRVALDALDLVEQLKSVRCASYLAEFAQSLSQVRSAVADDSLGQAAEHQLWQTSSLAPEVVLCAEAVTPWPLFLALSAWLETLRLRLLPGDLDPALEGLRFAVQSRTIKIGVVRIPVLTHTYVHITHERSVLLAGSRVTGTAVTFVNEHDQPWQRPSEGLPVFSTAALPEGSRTPGELLR